MDAVVGGDHALHRNIGRDDFFRILSGQVCRHLGFSRLPAVLKS